MELKYEITKKGNLLTHCPNIDICRVGSFYCCECKYFVSIDMDKQIVICNWSDKTNAK